jgi:hypothetical protein
VRESDLLPSARVDFLKRQNQYKKSIFFKENSNIEPSNLVQELQSFITIMPAYTLEKAEKLSFERVFEVLLNDKNNRIIELNQYSQISEKQ